MLVLSEQPDTPIKEPRNARIRLQPCTPRASGSWIKAPGQFCTNQASGGEPKREKAPRHHPQWKARMKRAITITLAALALAGTISTAGQVVTADNHKAHASTYTIRSVLLCTYDVTGRGYAWLQQRAYTDYNSWEEIFLGKRDFYTVIRTDRVPSQDYKCNTRYV